LAKNVEKKLGLAALKLLAELGRDPDVFELPGGCPAGQTGGGQCHDPKVGFHLDLDGDRNGMMELEAIASVLSLSVSFHFGKQHLERRTENKKIITN